MTTGKSFLLCALAAGLCVAGSAQAFCFLKGKNSARGMNHYMYQLPPIAFAPSRYHAYPYSMLPASTQPVQPDYLYMQQESNLPDGSLDRR